MEQGHPLLDSGGVDWAVQQLIGAGYEQTDVFHLARKVLDVLEPYLEANANMAQALPVIARLLEGKALTQQFWEPHQQEQQIWDWVQALPRMLYPGDMVRVRQDAYTGKRAQENGMEGVVVGIRNGIIVNYRGGRGMGWRHDVDKLEKRVPKRRVTGKDA